MNREAMRQAKMKQVQTVPTAAIRHVENCLLLLHGCSDEDLAAPVWKKGSHECFSHQEQRAKYQRNKHSPLPFFFLADPNSLSLYLPAPLSMPDTAKEDLCLPKQPASAHRGPVLHSAILKSKGLLGPPTDCFHYQ